MFVHKIKIYYYSRTNSGHGSCEQIHFQGQLWKLSLTGSKRKLIGNFKYLLAHRGGGFAGSNKLDTRV